MRSPFLRLPLALLFLIPVFVMQALTPRWTRPFVGRPADVVLGALVSCVLGWLAYRVYAKVVERRRGVEFGAQGALRELGAGLVIGAALFSATIGVLAALGLYTVQGWRDPGVLIAPLAMSAGAAVIEELLFRGVIFRIVEASLGTWIALVISAALFGLVHLGNPNASWLAAAAISLEAGVMLAAAYVLTRRLWLPIGIHAAWNFTQGGIFSVAVSAGKTDGLLVATLGGPHWLSGGEFGAEASVVAMLLCTALGAWLLVLGARRGKLMAPFWRRTGVDAVPAATP
ncbi:MAG TPA: CPBP family intramembrane glutamic endopeptidase [Burkholderiaceae bacterium]|nr:CPBP family intramembrane glutamic endopeptidase [Burkholderiaceae bacterium]